MSKILALDIGEKRIGFAVSDEERTMAFPRGFFTRLPAEKALAKMRTIVREERVGLIVIGVPLGEENEETNTGKNIRRFAADIARAVLVPIHFIDEFGSTREALSKIPFRKDRRTKGNDDAIAAQIILLRYLGKR